MRKTVRSLSYEMKCDICGKEESICHDNPTIISEFYTKHWTEIIMKEQDSFKLPPDQKRLDLCPKCSKKLKKIIKNVELEE